MRDTEAQISIDFLIGIVIFASIIFFAFQFVGSTAAPFISSQTSDQKVTKAHAVGDRLYHDILATEGGRVGKLNLSYFANSTDTGIKNESVVSDDVGLSQQYNLSIEVTKPNGDPVKLNGTNITVNGNASAPEIGGAGARVTRVGHTETNDTVVIDLEVW